MNPTLISYSFLFCMALLMAISHMRHSKTSCVEAYLLLGLSCLWGVLLCIRSDLIEFSIITAFSNMTLIGLNYFRKDNRIAAEISIKFLIMSLFLFCLQALSIFFVLRDPQMSLSYIFSWISLMLFMGVSPFFQSHVDFLEGAPPFAAVLLLGNILLGGGSFILGWAPDHLNHSSFMVLSVFASISLILPAILAVDQQRIGRMVAYVCMSQAGLALWFAITPIPMSKLFFWHVAIAIPAAFAGIRFWKHSRNSDKNWEDYAGAGRKHPWVGIAWLWILSSLAGAPFTLGFSFYREFSLRAIEHQQAWTLVIFMLSILVSMVPIVRLGVFMFGKPTRHDMALLHQPRQAFLILLCAFLMAITKIIHWWIPHLYETSIFAS